MRRLIPRFDPSVSRGLLKNISLASGGSVVIALLGIANTLILARFLSTVQFGTFLIVITIFEMTQLVVDIRVQEVLYRFYPVFEAEKKADANRALCLMAFTLCLVVGLLVSLILYGSAPAIGRRLYEDTELSGLLRVYALLAWLGTFRGFYAPLLRLHNEFGGMIAWQVAGRSFTLITVLAYVALLGGRDLSHIMTIWTISWVPQVLPPLLRALQIVRRDSTWAGGWGDIGSLKERRSEILSLLWHSNLAGYLKAAAGSGGLFLLGVIGGPLHVATFGVAQRLAAPLALLHESISVSISPEIMRLWAVGELGRVQQLVRVLKVWIIAGGGRCDGHPFPIL